MTNIYVSQVVVTRACDHRVTIILVVVQASVVTNRNYRRARTRCTINDYLLRLYLPPRKARFFDVHSMAKYCTHVRSLDFALKKKVQVATVLDIGQDGTPLTTAGLPFSKTHTKNQFANEPEGLRQFRDHR